MTLISAGNSVSIAGILRANGYNTSWFGKNHNTPPWQESQVGPFDQWPTGEIFGFDYFYGFMGGDANQWQPNLFRNTTAIYPFRGNPGWNLITAEADDAIRQINMVKSIDPDQPFFVYLAPGATHAPHHPTKEWIKKISDMRLFDEGWNKLRETIYANQKKLGVIPETAELTPWPDGLKKWDELTADEKKLFIRQVEVYAAYLAYCDHETGRVIQAIEDLGQLDNTLIIYIVGDNGSSAEGSPIGTPNEVAQFNGVTPPVDVQLRDFYDVWGSDQTYPHMAVAWTWAFDTPPSGPSRSHPISVASSRAWSCPGRPKSRMSAVTLVSTGRTFHFQDNLNDAWGEFSGGVNFFNFSQTTSVFAKVDVTLGDNLTGVGGKAGMRVAW